MGGVAHGGGVTSGLKLKKGGSAQPQATFGVGNNALRKTGPDGKEREAHVAFLPLLAPGAMTALRLAPRLLSRRGIASLGKFFSPKTGGTTMAGRAAARGPSGTRVLPGKAIRTTTPRGTTIRSATVRTPGARTRPGFMDYAKLAPRVGGATIAGGAGLGALSSLLPEFDDSRDDTLLENIVDAGRTGAEKALDVMGYLPSTIAQAPFRKFEDIQGLSGGIRTALYGADKPKISDDDTKTDFGDVIKAEEQTQEQKSAETLADLKDRSDAYFKLLNDQQPSSRLGDIGLAISAAAPGLLAEDYGQAAAAYGETLGARLDAERAADRELSLAAKQLAIGDMQKEEERAFQQDAATEQLLTAAMLEGDPTTQIRAQKLLNVSQEIGVENIVELPVKANGKPDTNKMRRKVVYTDVNKSLGGTFVAINKDGTEKITDNFLEAQQFANTQGVAWLHL